MKAEHVLVGVLVFIGVIAAWAANDHTSAVVTSPVVSTVDDRAWVREQLAQPPSLVPTPPPLMVDVGGTSRSSDGSSIPPLLPGETPPTDGPNYFDPSSLSSGGIAAALGGCNKTATISAPNMSSDWIDLYCQCSVNAMRRNFATSHSLQGSTPTLGQLKSCGTWLKSHGQRDPSKWLPEPFFYASPRGPVEVVEKLVKCGHSGASMVQCDCLVDFELASTATASIMPAANCYAVGQHYESTKQHLTVRQFKAMKFLKL
jgi:hypothetical protein